MIDLTKVKYKKRKKSGTKIIFVSPTKLLDRLEQDSESFSMRAYKGAVPKNQIGNRVQRAKEWIMDNYENPKAIFHPSQVGLYHWSWEPKGVRYISFGDGRHRVLAAEQMGISEVAIEIPISQEKYFEYMKVGSTNESPDYVQKYGLNYRDDDAVPFGCYSQGKSVAVGIGERGGSHGSIESSSHVMRGEVMFGEYSGRLWLKKKVISFWEFPDKDIFTKIVNQLESILKRKGWIKKPMWNNGWKVEVILVKGEVPVDSPEDWEWPRESEYDEITHKEIPFSFIKLVPIEDYLKSENFPDEIKQWHLMTSREKEELKKSGQDPLKYWKSLGKDVPLAYKQAIYQEKMITKFNEFEKNI